MPKTLCNLENGMVAMCDGSNWEFSKQQKHCDGALEAHRNNDQCMHLCDNERCDSYIAQDIAVKSKK